MALIILFSCTIFSSFAQEWEVDYSQFNKAFGKVYPMSGGSFITTNDSLVMKLDPIGQIEWTQNMHFGDSLVLNDVIYDMASNSIWLLKSKHKNLYLFQLDIKGELVDYTWITDFGGCQSPHNCATFTKTNDGFLIQLIDNAGWYDNFDNSSESNQCYGDMLVKLDDTKAIEWVSLGIPQSITQFVNNSEFVDSSQVKQLYDSESLFGSNADDPDVYQFLSSNSGNTTVTPYLDNTWILSGTDCTLTAGKIRQYFVSRVDYAGNVLWEYVYLNTEFPYVPSLQFSRIPITTTSDGNIILYYYGEDTSNDNNKYILHLTKINAQGEIIREDTYPVGSDRLIDFITDPKGDIYLLFNSHPIVFQDKYYVEYPETTFNIHKISNTGEFLWEKTFEQEHIAKQLWYTENGLYVSGASLVDAPKDILDIQPFLLYIDNDEINSPLTTSLLQFRGKSINKYIKLDWQTASEFNLAYFEIEKSTDGINFLALGERIYSDENHQKGASYTLRDDDVSPLHSYYYYRLKSVDHDGNFQQHQTIVVQIESIKTVRFLPTNNHTIDYQLHSFVEQVPYTIKMYDIMGRLITEQPIDGSRGTIQLPNNSYSIVIYEIISSTEIIGQGKVFMQ